MATRPTTVPQLDTTKANRTIPAGSKVTSGYSTNDFFPAASANYLHGWAGDWLEWLEERTEDGTTPTTDFTLRGLDALTLTGDGGVLTLVGGDGGGTSGDGGNILLLPGGVTSGTDGYVGIGTSAPDAPLHMLYDEPWIKLETSDTAEYSEIMFQTVGDLSRWEVGAYASAAGGRAGQLFIFQSTNIAGASIGTVQFALTDGGQVQITEDLLVKGDYVRFATQNDYIYHDAGADEFQLWLDSAEHWTFSKTTLDCKQNTITECSAMVIGTGLAGVSDALIIHDNTFGIGFDGTDPFIQFKGTPDALIRYDRADDELIFHIVGNDEWMFDETTLDCKQNTITECSAMVIGTGLAGVANALVIHDNGFGLGYDGDDPFLQLDGTPTIDKLWFDRSENEFIVHIAGNDEWTFDETALDCQGNNLVDVGTITSDSIAATATGTNDVGVTGTGDGTGSGVNGQGGASNGDGVFGTGGVTSGRGVVGYGTGSGDGVNGYGAGTGDGVLGTGGSTNGYGVVGTGGSTNGTGIYGHGTGSGDGILAVGGNTNGSGIVAQGVGTGTGVEASSATGYGVAATGNATKTPVRLVPQAAPSSFAEGDIYYDSGTHKLVIRVVSGWETVTSA